MLILDLTTSRLCYMISEELEQIKPKGYHGYEGCKGRSYEEIIKIALLSTYNYLENNKTDENLIYFPAQLEENKNTTVYRDDLIQTSQRNRYPLYDWEDLLK